MEKVHVLPPSNQTAGIAEPRTAVAALQWQSGGKFGEKIL